LTVYQKIKSVCHPRSGKKNNNNKSTFAKNGSFEIGLKLFGSSIESFGRFNKGDTIACLKSDGQMPWLMH